jgi:hypothetical protein
MIAKQLTWAKRALLHAFGSTVQQISIVRAPEKLGRVVGAHADRP